MPYLKVGYLTAPPAGNPVAPHGDWKRTQFVLNHEGLQQVFATFVRIDTKKNWGFFPLEIISSILGHKITLT